MPLRQVNIIPCYFDKKQPEKVTNRFLEDSFGLAEATGKFIGGRSLLLD